MVFLVKALKFSSLHILEFLEKVDAKEAYIL